MSENKMVDLPTTAATPSMSVPVGVKLSCAVIQFAITVKDNAMQMFFMFIDKY
jgi:hypothetical protein